MKSIISLALLIVAAPLASAQYCNRVVQTQVVQQAQPVYAAPATVYTAATFQYQPVVLLAAYSAAYSPSAPAAATAPSHEPSQCEQTAAVLAKMLDKMDRQNDVMLDIAKRIGGNQIPQPLPPGPPPAVQPRQPEPIPAPTKTSALAFARGKTFVARCASCHDKAVVDSKGMDPTLAFFVNKAPIPLTGDQAFDCLKALNNGSMPKGQQITEEEFLDLQGTIGELRVARAATGYPSAPPALK